MAKSEMSPLAALGAEHPLPCPLPPAPVPPVPLPVPPVPLAVVVVWLPPAPCVVDPADPLLVVVEPELPPAPDVVPELVLPVVFELVEPELVVPLPLPDAVPLVPELVVVLDVPLEPVAFGFVVESSEEQAANAAKRMLGPRAWIILRSVFMGRPAPFVTQVQVRRSGRTLGAQ
jgi:hypothetical protein